MTYREFFVASASRTLYIGVTNNLERRIWEHRIKVLGGFTAKYNIHRLVYVEVHPRIDDAIAREKQLKNWNRARKIALIERENPEWQDLSRDWPIGGREESG
jgi:putative endonuclease